MSCADGDWCPNNHCCDTCRYYDSGYYKCCYGEWDDSDEEESGWDSYGGCAD